MYTLCNGEQGEWEGTILDLALTAMQAFPSAAFLGTFQMYFLDAYMYSCMYLYVLVCTCMYLYVLVCTCMYLNVHEIYTL